MSFGTILIVLLAIEVILFLFVALPIIPNPNNKYKIIEYHGGFVPCENTESGWVEITNERFINIIDASDFLNKYRIKTDKTVINTYNLPT